MPMIESMINWKGDRMLFIKVTEVKWADTKESTDEPTFIEFSVFKKGLLGKLKEIRECEGSCLGFTHDRNGEINLDSFSIQDGNFQEVPLNPQFLNSILRSAQDEMIKAGDTYKASILSRAAQGYFKKYVLKH